jgi:iron(II)-dependent oxidoreductase
VPLAIQFSQSTREAFSALSTGGSGVTPKELLWGLAHVWGRSVLVASAVAAALVALVFNYPPSVVGARNLPAMFALELEAPRAEVPAMVRLAGGEFSMGASTGALDEQPVHQVMVAPFEMSRTEVTMAEYRACVDAKVCREPGSGGSCNWGVAGRERHPVNCVSWDDAHAFATRLGMRLPSEAEWEFAARGGGANVEYPWGDAPPDCSTAVVSGCGDRTRPVCSIAAGATRQGLCDMAGNVLEWVEDDYHDNYIGAPTDGTSWSDRPRDGSRVLRGGSWRSDPPSARVAARFGFVPNFRYDIGNLVGFRVARSLP